MVAVSPSVERTCFLVQNAQPSEPLTSVEAFDFDIEEQWCQATSSKENVSSQQTSYSLVTLHFGKVIDIEITKCSTISGFLKAILPSTRKLKK